MRLFRHDAPDLAAALRAFNRRATIIAHVRADGDLS